MLLLHLQQPVIIKKLTGPKQKSQKSNIVQTAMHCVSCAMLSEVSRVTLHRVFTCAILSQEYYDNIERIFSCGMLSGAFLTTFHKAFTCAMLS